MVLDFTRAATYGPHNYLMSSHTLHAYDTRYYLTSSHPQIIQNSNDFLWFSKDLQRFLKNIFEDHLRTSEDFQMLSFSPRTHNTFNNPSQGSSPDFLTISLLLHPHTCTIHYRKFEDLLVQYLLKIVELFIAIILISQVRAFLKPPMLGVVLQTYGCGNAPNNRDDLITEIKKATRRDVLIINCTQCLHGPVVDQYATGKVNLRNWRNHA